MLILATDKIQTGLRLDADILSKVKVIAKRNKRSLNSQIEFVVQEYVREYEKENGVIEIDPEE